nr:MAG TPA: hypothetical protein [Caudoviricetes sp.]DAX70223.1 MAG TPA: hypothetical protein [Caudoviricetes sp.]
MPAESYLICSFTPANSKKAIDFLIFQDILILFFEESR